MPPLNAGWIVSMVEEAYNREEGLGLKLRHKKQIYGTPGDVSKNHRIIKKEFENGDANFYLYCTRGWALERK